jgi:hypothetical protein
MSNGYGKYGDSSRWWNMMDHIGRRKKRKDNIVCCGQAKNESSSYPKFFHKVQPLESKKKNELQQSRISMISNFNDFQFQHSQHH